MPNSSTVRRSFRAPWIIFWAAFALRIACILIGHTYRIRLNDDHFDFGFEAGRIARALLEGRGYADPFNGHSGPTAWLPPLYPLLMALAFKLFGIYTNSAAFFLLACNSLFSAAVAPAVYEIAARCFDAYGLAQRSSRKMAPVALWSAWLWAAYPAALQFAVHWLWEMSLSTCLLMWTLVLALRLRDIGEESLEAGSSQPTTPAICHLDRTMSAENEEWRDPRISSAPPQLSTPHARDLKLWAIFGLLWGLIALSNASLLLVLPATLLWILRPQRPWVTAIHLRPFAGAALACVLVAAVMSPWIIRNERTMHAFIPTRDNLGVELWQSSLFYHEAFPWGTAMPLWPGHPEFQRYVAMGEFRYAQQKEVEARRNLRAHPELFLRYTLQRIDFFWFGSPHDKLNAGEVIRTLNYNLLSIAGLLGLGWAMKRRVPAAWLMASVFLLIPIAYYVVTVQARFRHPIEPLIAILSVYLFRSTTPRQSRATLNPTQP